MINESENAAHSRVFLADDVTMQRRETGGFSGGLLHDGGTGKYYHVGSSETFVLSKIAAGYHDLMQLVSLLGSVELDWNAEDLGRFVETLTRAGLLRVTMDPPGAAAPDSGSANAMADNSDAAGMSGQTSGDSTSQELPPAVTSSAGTRPNEGAPSLSPEAGTTPQDAGSGDGASPTPNAGKGGLAGFVRPLSWLISIRVPLGNFDAAAASLVGRIGWLLHPLTMAVAMGWIVVMMTMVTLRHDAMMADLTRMFDRGLWLPMMAIWVIAKIWHELGHAIAAKRRGVRLGNVGVMFFLFAPLAYVDVTDAWRLRRRGDRITIAMAGVYFELLVASVAAAIWCTVDAGITSHVAAQVFLITGPATLLVNANPLLRLDGYYALSDLVDIPNLRSHGRGALSGIVDRAISGATPPPTLLSGWRKGFATFHALASVIFQVFWMGGLIVAVSYMSDGLGVVLAIAALLLWVVLPIGTYLVRRTHHATSWRDHLRLVTSVATILVASQWALSSTSPLARRVPVIVDDAAPQIARSPVDAFVEDVLVISGESVTRGQLLMRLRNDDLQIRREEMADEVELLRHDATAMRRRGELAAAAAAAEQASMMSDRLNRLQSRLQDLEVVATRDGQIQTPKVDQWRGRFVSAGDVLVTVSDPGDKELIVSVDNASITAYERAARLSLPVPVRFRGGRRVEVQPAKLRPSSSRELPDPAMAADVGGPIPVEPNGKDGMQTVAVRTVSRCRLSPIASMQLFGGQIGSMRIGDDRSIGARLWAWLNEGLK